MQIIKKARIILIGIVLITVANSNDLLSQEASSKNDGFTFNLVAPFFHGAPRYTFGYIQSIGSKFQIGAEYGIGKQGINLFEAPRLGEAYQLKEARLQVFYEVRRGYATMPNKIHVGLELYKINHTDRYFDKSYMDPNGDYFDFDIADYSRTKWAINLTGSYLQRLSPSIGINLSLGIGAKHRNIQFSNIENQEPIGKIVGLLRAINVQGNGWFMNMDIGAKVIWIWNKK